MILYCNNWFIFDYPLAKERHIFCILLHPVHIYYLSFKENWSSTNVCVCVLCESEREGEREIELSTEVNLKFRKHTRLNCILDPGD